MFWGSRAGPRAHAAKPDWIPPALIRFADECSATLGGLLAYVGILALFAIVGVHLWNQLPEAEPLDPAVAVDWTPATRSLPAFAVSQPELVGKTETYDIFRHPGGGRKDVIHWAAIGDKPIAELEIYRAGVELPRSEPAFSGIAERLAANSDDAIEAAGVIDSKFGPVTLLRPTAPTGHAASCLGFVQRFEYPDLNPALRISGWSCQGDTLPARRAAIGCILNRLTLLTAGNDPKLADLFARAELRRGSCAPVPESAAAANWVTAAENPRLRGGL
jgi:hypothetical protein